MHSFCTCTWNLKNQILTICTIHPCNASKIATPIPPHPLPVINNARAPNAFQCCRNHTGQMFTCLTPCSSCFSGSSVGESLRNYHRLQVSHSNNFTRKWSETESSLKKCSPYNSEQLNSLWLSWMRGQTRHYESEGAVVFVQNFTDGDSIVRTLVRKDATLINKTSSRKFTNE